MKKYIEFMDGVQVSDTLHQRLVELKAPQKHPAPWKRYGAVAAALALVVGVGGAGLAQSGGWGQLACAFQPLADPLEKNINDEREIEADPDIALVEPGNIVEPGTPIMGGYEVRGEDNGPGTVAYYPLPAIEYGRAEAQMEMALDWDIPRGAVKRELTQEDIAALFGKEENLALHLDWGGYTLTGWAAWYEDGTFWGVFLNGYAGPLDHFELAVTTGQIPPTCVVYAGSAAVVNDIWGVAVTADMFESQSGVDRQVSFMNEGYGCRFSLTSTDVERSAGQASRLVRWMIPSSGLAVDAITADGAAPVQGPDPNYSVGEPNWVDGAPACPYCADGTVHTHPYDPREAADPLYNAPGGADGGMKQGGRLSEGGWSYAPAPPELTLSCGDGSLTVCSSTYEWSGLDEAGNGTNTVACGPHPLEWVIDIPRITADRDWVALDFGLTPDRVVRVERWPESAAGSTDGDVYIDGEAAVVDGGEIMLEAGSWIYELTAEWDGKGSGSYVFCVAR